MAENLNQRWEASDELDFAWFGFASEYEKEQYRNATDRDRMETLSIMTKAELIAKIRNEELYCFGLRTAPNLSEGPERIPSFLFVELGKRGLPYVTGAGQRGVTGAGNLKAGLAPRYDQKTFPASEKRGQLRLVGSLDGRDGSLVIHQETDIYDAPLSSGDAVTGGEDPLLGDVKNVHRHEPFQGPKPRR